MGVYLLLSETNPMILSSIKYVANGSDSVSIQNTNKFQMLIKFTSWIFTLKGKSPGELSVQFGLITVSYSNNPILLIAGIVQ